MIIAPLSREEALLRIDRLNVELEKVVNLQARPSGKAICVKFREGIVQNGEVAELLELFEQFRIRTMKEKTAELKFLNRYLEE